MSCTMPQMTLCSPEQGKWGGVTIPLVFNCAGGKETKRLTAAAQPVPGGRGGCCQDVLALSLDHLVLCSAFQGVWLQGLLPASLLHPVTDLPLMSGQVEVAAWSGSRGTMGGAQRGRGLWPGVCGGAEQGTVPAWQFLGPQSQEQHHILRLLWYLVPTSHPSCLTPCHRSALRPGVASVLLLS